MSLVEPTSKPLSRPLPGPRRQPVTRRRDSNEQGKSKLNVRDTVLPKLLQVSQTTPEQDKTKITLPIARKKSDRITAPKVITPRTTTPRARTPRTNPRTIYVEDNSAIGKVKIETDNPWFPKNSTGFTDITIAGITPMGTITKVPTASTRADKSKYCERVQDDDSDSDNELGKMEMYLDHNKAKDYHHVSNHMKSLKECIRLANLAHAESDSNSD
jgi:hypothetical protein